MNIKEIINYFKKFNGYTVTPRVRGKVEAIKEDVLHMLSAQTVRHVLEDYEREKNGKR